MPALNTMPKHRHAESQWHQELAYVPSHEDRLNAHLEQMRARRLEQLRARTRVYEDRLKARNKVDIMPILFAGAAVIFTILVFYP